MEADPNQITFFAETNFRNREVPFGIKTDDRRRHMYVIGKTGMGKTTMMENMAVQDIRNGHGVCFMDPHGDSVVKILNYIPSERINDVVYFNPADLEYPIAFNIMESVEGRFKHLVASGLMGVFTKIWANLWSARMEYILGNTIRALLDSPGNSMLGITRMYIDKQYRKRIVDNIKDPMVRVFWTDEYANYDQKYVKEAIAPIQNKVGQFLSSAIIRNIVGQPKSTIDLREIMDGNKILLMDLSKGKVGEENAALLGAMIITKLQLAAMSRVDIPENERSDFYLYVDEFQNFATESFATILSEARKYHLNLIMGHQYIGQLTPTKDNSRLRDAIFGNVGTMVCFRIGAADAEYLETEFAPLYTPSDLVNLPKYQILLKLMINGVSSEPFSARGIQVKSEFFTGNAEKVIKVSRERYGNPVMAVEEKISRWMGAEFHQQNAVMVISEAEVLDKEEAPKPRLDSKSEVKATEINPQSEVSASEDEDSSLKFADLHAPLVFELPDVPKPKPVQPFGPKQFFGKQHHAAGRERPPHFNASSRGQFGANRERQKQPLHASHNKPNRTKEGKPNIWDTVNSMHEEKTQGMARAVTRALEAVPISAPAPSVKADSPTSHAAKVKQILPGEVHKF